LDGNQAILTTFEEPEKEEEPIRPEAQNASILEFIDEEKLKEINDLIEQTDVHKSVLVDVTDFDKDKRSIFHNVLRKEFGKKTSNNTIVTEIGKKYIQVKKFNKYDQDKGNRGWQWPHEYTYFVMFKENIDTIQAVSTLARNMKLKPSQFTYAGTKDRRAKTSQWISIKKYEPYRISQAAKRTQGVKVGDFKFLPKPLKLGELSGNRFRVALRSVKGDQDEIEKSLKSLQQFGFINYYGLQRFGNSTEVTTFDVGKALLKSDFQEAVDLILKERDGEPDNIKKMRTCWREKRDANEALKYIDSYSMTVEAKLLRALAQSKNDYLQALLQLPRNMLMLYTHSYQSLIFNTLTSKRRQLGLEVMEGDLIFKEEPKQLEEEIVEVAEDEVEADSEEAELKESVFKDMVRPLTKEDIESGNYTIFDIVLSLPGFDITYPSNEIGKLYEELLANDGLSSEKLKGKHR
jgi:tRNA pseudouridine13 synthase